ncbi:MAG: response regulator transcription factor [Anaerolineae bacterium]|nr:response regulator transcription factor [Anaerolineae bacterium]MBT7190669.1 response regulator transcription factor [Anaerolineae bacterium]MBT7991309.1 response regulator transcription factor [Anaerolineae bacterium]
MRVLVVDDHSLFRDGVVSLLRAAGMKIVGEAGDGKAAVQEALRLKPDLVLLDIHMPEGGGLTALKQIRSQLPETKVVMLTVSENNDNLIEAITSGAHGYLLKSLNAKGFLASLEGLQRGEAAMTRTMMAQLLGAVSNQANPEEVREKNQKFDLLTEREIELLQVLSQGFSNKAIAQQLHISENTVKYHMKKIMQKTNLQNRTEVAAYAVRNGLIEENTDSEV